MKLPPVHPAVWDEFNDAVCYYAAEAGAEIALAFEDCVFRHFDEIQITPLIYRERKWGIRRANLGPQFKEWYIAYMLWKESVVILAIAHAKRRPFYFRRRVTEARRMFR